MGVNGKAKGNSFERQVANIFSERFSSLFGVDKPFRRNVDSGSFYGNKNSFRMVDSVSEHIRVSDILSPDSFRFVLECKSYKDAPSLFNVISSGSDLIDSWLSQVVSDVSNLNAHTGRSYVPALVMKWNRTPIFVMCPMDVFEPMDLFLSHFVYRFILNELWVGITLDDFLELDDSRFVLGI